ncbi:MAG: MFS transporter [Pseudomonadota bacterium]
MAESPTALSLTRSEVRTALTLSGAAVLRMIGLFMLLPVLALWARELDGATPWLVGVAVSAYGLSQAALQIPFGALSDRIGRRTVVMGALAIFVVGSVIAGLANDVTTLIAGRILQGAGAVSAALTAWLADASRPGVRVRVNAIFGASIGASFALALVIGPLLAAALSIRALFWCAAGLGLLAMLLVTVVPSVPRRDKVRATPAELWQAFREPSLRALVVSVWALHALLIALFVAFPLVIERYGFAAESQWRIYLVALFASLAFVVPMLRRAEGDGAQRLATPAWLVMALGLSLVAVALPDLWGVTAALTVFFAGFNFLEASLPAWISLLAPAALRGACLGVFSTAQFFGAFCGGVLGAVLLRVDMPGDGLLVLALVALGPALALRPRRRLASEPAESRDAS